MAAPSYVLLAAIVAFQVCSYCPISGSPIPGCPLLNLDLNCLSSCKKSSPCGHSNHKSTHKGSSKPTGDGCNSYHNDHGHSDCGSCGSDVYSSPQGPPCPPHPHGPPGPNNDCHSDCGSCGSDVYSGPHDQPSPCSPPVPSPGPLGPNNCGDSSCNSCGSDVYSSPPGPPECEDVYRPVCSACDACECNSDIEVVCEYDTYCNNVCSAPLCPYDSGEVYHGPLIPACDYDSIIYSGSSCGTCEYNSAIEVVYEYIDTQTCYDSSNIYPDGCSPCGCDSYCSNVCSAPLCPYESGHVYHGPLRPPCACDSIEYTGCSEYKPVTKGCEHCLYSQTSCDDSYYSCSDGSYYSCTDCGCDTRPCHSCGHIYH